MTDSILRYTYNVSSSTFVPFAVTVGEFLLDAYPNASLAYSLRKLRTAYAGSAMRIRRDSDDAETDIGFDGNGDIDSAAISTFTSAGTTDAFFVTWYDQSGNGIDVTQSTQALQPLLSVSSFAGHRAAQMFGAGEHLAKASLAASSIASTQITVFTAWYVAGADNEHCLIDWNTGTSRLYSFPAYQDIIYFAFGTDNGTTGQINVGQPGGWDDNPHIVESYRDSGDNQAIVVDGTNLLTATRTDDLTGTATLYIGRSTDDGVRSTGSLAELVIWPTDLAGDRAAARTNINDYYGVF